jgi:protein LSM14
MLNPQNVAKGQKGRGGEKGQKGQKGKGSEKSRSEPKENKPPPAKAAAPAVPAAVTAAAPLEEFDFQSNNARFDKEKETADWMQQLSIGGAAPPGVTQAASMFPEGTASFPVYNKKSFFDELSCEANTEKRGGGTMKEQRALDVETFGAAGNERSRYGRKGRGRGGGKGGNRRGGGRGGKGKNQQSSQATAQN